MDYYVIERNIDIDFSEQPLGEWWKARPQRQTDFFVCGIVIGQYPHLYDGKQCDNERYFIVAGPVSEPTAEGIARTSNIFGRFRPA